VYKQVNNQNGENNLLYAKFLLEQPALYLFFYCFLLFFSFFCFFLKKKTIKRKKTIEKKQEQRGAVAI